MEESRGIKEQDIGSIKKERLENIHKILGISKTATYTEFCKQEIEKTVGRLVEINPSKLFVASLESSESSDRKERNPEEVDTYWKKDALMYDRFLDPLFDKYKVDIKTPYIFDGRHAGGGDFTLTYNGKTINDLNIIFAPDSTDGRFEKYARSAHDKIVTGEKPNQLELDAKDFFELKKRILIEFNSLGLLPEAISEIRIFFQWLYDEVTGRRLDEVVARGYLEKSSAEQIKNAKEQGKTITSDQFWLLEVDPNDTSKTTNFKIKKYWAIS